MAAQEEAVPDVWGREGEVAQQEASFRAFEGFLGPSSILSAGCHQRSIAQVLANAGVN